MFVCVRYPPCLCEIPRVRDALVGVQLACNLRLTCRQLAYGQALEDAQAVIPVPAKILLLP